MHCHDVESGSDLLRESLSELPEIIDLLLLCGIFELVRYTALIYHLHGSDLDG